jgi:hypothetical protein
MARSKVDPIARPIRHPRKIMIKVFFGVKKITLIIILPETNKLSSEYFKENIIKELDLVVYPVGQKPCATRICLHFDNASVHNARTIAQTMAEYNLCRLDHPVHSLNFTSYDSFLLATCTRKWPSPSTRQWKGSKRRSELLSSSSRSPDWLHFFQK